MMKILLYPFFPPHFSFKTIRNSSTHTLSRLQEEARNFSAAGGGGGGILKSPESEHPSSEGSPSLDLLLQFQRLLISRIFSSKSAAEGKLVGSGCEEVKGQVKCKDGDSFKVYGETSKSSDHFSLLFRSCYHNLRILLHTTAGRELLFELYLGALISSDGRNNTEISARIAQAKMTFQKMKTVLTNSHISIHTRKRTLECYIEPILMYGCEAWTISKQAQKKLEAVENMVPEKNDENIMDG